MIYRNLFRVTKKYSYGDVTRVIACYREGSKRPEKYKIYVGKKKITVDYLMKNFLGFDQLMKRRLKKAGNPIKFETAVSKI